MSKTYEDERWCDICNKYTQQTFTDSEHERDSSNDRAICHECGGMWWGCTGKWEPSRKD